MEIAKKVCNEMLSQRKWSITTGTITDDNNSVIDIFSGETLEGNSYVTMFLESGKLNIANIKDCIKYLQQHGTKHCIIVYNNNITSSAKKVISNFVDTVFELFAVNDLQTNITKHYYVPKHLMLNTVEEAAFKSRMGTDIPVLLKTDKVCRFYNYPKGAIIMVNRLDKSVGYRIVK
jgi:DNA-directed RNA polymerase subunit H (RpoH/RPB5)